MSLDLDALQKLADAATPGPWAGGCCQKEILPGRFVLHAYGPAPKFIDNPWDWTQEHRPEIIQTKRDAEFIAASRQAIPELIQMVNAARIMIKQMEQSATKERLEHLAEVKRLGDSNNAMVKVNEFACEAFQSKLAIAEKRLEVAKAVLEDYSGPNKMSETTGTLLNRFNRFREAATEALRALSDGEEK